MHTPTLKDKNWTENISLPGSAFMRWVLAAGVVLVLFLAFYNLAGFPTTWFDEGSHLHVPKTFVRFGVYADYSSEGYRYFGPTTGIGPTVFLPIAWMFKLFGIGLLQARLVIVLYLIVCIALIFRLGQKLGGWSLALFAAALAISSRGVNLQEYGREVLGEVPGMVFLLGGLLVWFSSWERPTWKRLVSAGLLLGLSLVTKNQYLIVLAPGLGLAFLANLLYYRAAPQRAFWVTGFVTVMVYALWQFILIFALGPGTGAENFALFRKAATDSALIFSTDLMKHSVSELLSLKVFFGLLIPGLVYGFFLALPRKRSGLIWGVLFFMTVSNLAWYVLASIGWLRYAFPALLFSTFFLARMFLDWSDGFRIPWRDAWISLRRGNGLDGSIALKAVLGVWMVGMLLVPFAQNLVEITRAPDQSPFEMAAYLDSHVAKTALVETWEPEMGFLTDHNYHFPPPATLYEANSYIWLGKAPPSSSYHFVEENLPDYVLVGAFSTWVKLYPSSILETRYVLEKSAGAYSLYARK